MSYEYMTRDKYQISYAIGTDLTAWDNAQAALVVAELNALDWFHSGSVVHTKPLTQTANPAPGSHIPKRITIGRQEGKYSATHYLQTGILTYATMGACITTEATPNTHDITKQTTTTPIRLAFHLEKEGTNIQRRKDIMAFIPQSLDISVSENSTLAFQKFNSVFAYTGAGADLELPTALVQSTHGPYTWFHLKNASSATAYTYNTGAINDDIVSYDIHIGWGGYQWGPYDGNYYRTAGFVKPPFDSYIDVGVRTKDYTDTDSFAISDLDHASYVGDLNMIIDFYESANRYLKYTFTDMYLDPESFEETFKSENEWYDGVTYRLKFRNETSSLVVQEKNALNNDYYENP